jgi:hypothetical protein
MGMAILRDLSIILLVLTTILLGTLPLLAIGALVYGLGRLQRRENLPNWLGLAHAYVKLAQAYIELAMAAVARPVFVVNSALAKARGWRGEVERFLKGERR